MEDKNWMKNISAMLKASFHNEKRPCLFSAEWHLEEHQLPYSFLPG